jgi:hypothetical protein
MNQPVFFYPKQQLNNVSGAASWDSAAPRTAMCPPPRARSGARAGAGVWWRWWRWARQASRACPGRLHDLQRLAAVPLHVLVRGVGAQRRRDQLHTAGRWRARNAAVSAGPALPIAAVAAAACSHALSRFSSKSASASSSGTRSRRVLPLRPPSCVPFEVSRSLSSDAIVRIVHNRHNGRTTFSRYREHILYRFLYHFFNKNRLHLYRIYDSVRS